MRIEFTLTPKELVEASNIILKQRSGIGDSRLKMVAIIVVLLAIFYFQLYTAADAQYRYHIMIAGTVIAVVLGFLLHRFPVPGRKPSHVVMDFSIQGIVATSTIARDEIDWSVFVHHVETADLFLLERSPVSDWIIIPKRAFANEAQLGEFRNYLASIQPKSLLASMIRAATVVQPQAVGHGLPQAAVVAEFKYGYRDYLDMVVASWLLRGLLLLIVVLMFGAGMWVSLTNDKAHDDRLWAIDVAGWAVAFFVLIPLFRAALLWLCDPVRNLRQNYTFSDDGMTVASSLGTSTMSWTTYSAFKETPWSFLLWAKKAGSLESATCLIPKRALSSPSNVAWLRDTLAAKLPRSTWYLW